MKDTTFFACYIPVLIISPTVFVFAWSAIYYPEVKLIVSFETLMEHLWLIQRFSIESTLLSLLAAIGIFLWNPVKSTRIVLAAVLLFGHLCGALFLIFARSM